MSTEVDRATRAHFTVRAATYAGGGDASLAAILELAALRPGDAALDVATGTGLVLFRLAEAVGEHGRAVGIDFTAAMLAQAATRRASLPPGSTPPALIAADAAQLPFRPDAFDAVTCRFSVHHMSEPAASLSAMTDALRPGGRLVIADFVRPDDPAEAERHDRLERLRGHQHVQIYAAAQLEAMLAAAGCPVRERRTTDRAMDPRDWLTSPNVAPQDRDALARLIAEIEPHGGAGFEAQSGDGSVRLVRQDVVFGGIKE